MNIDTVRDVVESRVLLEVGRKAIEDALIEWRDDRLSEPLRGNGLVIREKDGTPSNIIRFGPELALRIALNAIVAHMEVDSTAGPWPRGAERESEPAGWRWKYGDTDHHKWVVSDLKPPPFVEVFRLEPLFPAPTREVLLDCGICGARPGPDDLCFCPNCEAVLVTQEEADAHAAGVTLPSSTEFKEAKHTIMEVLSEEDVRSLAVSQFILLQLNDKYALGVDVPEGGQSNG